MVMDDGSVYDTDFRFPMEVIPVSTFIQIGTSKMSHKCWIDLVEISRPHTYTYKGKSFDTLFEALIKMATNELNGNACYNILTVEFSEEDADGMMPEISDDVTMDEKQKLLVLHAKKIDIFVATTIDEFFCERFELMDSDGSVKEFVF